MALIDASTFRGARDFYAMKNELRQKRVGELAQVEAQKRQKRFEENQRANQELSALLRKREVENAATRTELAKAKAWRDAREHNQRMSTRQLEIDRLKDPLYREIPPAVKRRLASLEDKVYKSKVPLTAEEAAEFSAWNLAAPTVRVEETEYEPPPIYIPGEQPSTGATGELPSPSTGALKTLYMTYEAISKDPKADWEIKQDALENMAEIEETLRYNEAKTTVAPAIVEVQKMLDEGITVEEPHEINVEGGSVLDIAKGMSRTAKKPALREEIEAYIEANILQPLRNAGYKGTIEAGRIKAQLDDLLDNIYGRVGTRGTKSEAAAASAVTDESMDETAGYFSPFED